MTIEEQIAAIDALPYNALKQRWRKHFRRDPPKGLPPKLMKDAFIYAVQEAAFGGLTPKRRRALDRLAKKIERDPNAPLVDDFALRPGSRLIRDWRGKRYEIEVLEKGFEFNGKIYSNLSEIARTITGAHWSGPRFFGLRANKRS